MSLKQLQYYKHQNDLTMEKESAEKKGLDKHTIFGKWIPAFLIAAGITLLGIFINGGLGKFASNSRVVTVRGLSEREVNANKVTWPIVSKQVGNDLTSIYKEVETTNNAIVQFLKANGITESEYSVNAPKVQDMQADNYGGATAPYRYNVTSVVVVTTDKVAKVNELMSKQSELIAKGIAIVAGDYNYQTLYEFTELNSIKPDMVADATKNARKAAKKFSEDSHSKLGKIKTASQGQFSIEDRDQYTPYIKKVRVVSTIQYYLED